VISPGSAGRSVLEPLVPTVRFHVADACGALGRALSDAVALLIDDGLVRAAGRATRADLVHTVGDVYGSLAAGPAGRRVHTLDRVELRPSGQLAPTWRWLRRQRPRASGCSAVLTHGRTAGRVVVDSALAPGERVFCLPVLPAPAAAPGAPHGRATVARIAARRRLGVPPGVRLVIGTPSGSGAAVGDWATALRRLGRRDLLVAAAGDLASSTSGEEGSWWQLVLEAADVFIAAGRELSAASAAVSCIGLGVPVITVTTDSAAEVVTPGWDGRVVAPRVDSIVDAVVSALDGAWLPLRRTSGIPGPGPRTQDLARHLLTIYEEALASPAPTGRDTA
jgi:hypothetical protein